MKRSQYHHCSILAVCLALVFALAAQALFSADAQSTWVQLDPAQQSTAVGQVVEVTVRVDNVIDMVGFDIKLVFDPLVVAIDDADADTEGVQVLPGDFPHPDYVVRNVVDNDAGTLWYAAVQTSPRAPATGSGTALTLRFRALAQGMSQVSFDALKIVDETGAEIAADRSGTLIEVGAGGLPGPPTPSTTPGANGYPAPEDATATATSLATASAPARATPAETPTLTSTTAGSADGQPTASTRTTGQPRRTRTPTPGQAGAEPSSTPSPQPLEPEVTPTEAVAADPTPAPMPTALVDEPRYPWLPPEIMLALGVLLLAITLLLFLYLSRAGQKPAARPRGRLR